MAQADAATGRRADTEGSDEDEDGHGGHAGSPHQPHASQCRQAEVRGRGHRRRGEAQPGDHDRTHATDTRVSGSGRAGPGNRNGSGDGHTPRPGATGPTRRGGATATGAGRHTPDARKTCGT